jgi:D-hexose-6-phosphate mutarotase
VNGVELLYTPPTLADDLKQGKPIEGGIPIIFPQFDKGSGSGLEVENGGTNWATMPPNGFARLLPWKVDDRQSAVQPDGSVHLVLSLVDSSQTRLRGFPYAFELEYGIKLTSRSLQVSLTVANPRLAVWTEGFQCMLHSHLAIQPVRDSRPPLANVSILGLSGASYYDRRDDGVKVLETSVSSRDPDTGEFARGLGGLRFDQNQQEEIDRVYLSGTGFLGTFTSAEVHVSPEESTESQESTAGVKSGVTMVEATCSRAAMATWGDVTPSPDMLITAGRENGVVCVAPGLISTPITSLVSGRMTLTQTITHRPDGPS